MERVSNKSQRAPRRTEALSRDAIVEAAIEILDADGEEALTLRALTLRLTTGYGAIYHHVADRSDLLAAAADHVVARIVTDIVADAVPQQALRAIALGLFDAIVAHPWVGDQLTREPWMPALLDVYESVSEQVQALAVEKFVHGGSATAPEPREVLSNREMEVFRLLGEGLETRRIAEMLGLNIKTVQTFCAKIKDKLHLANASELMRESVRWAESGSMR